MSSHWIWLIPIILVIILVMMTRKRSGDDTHTTPSPKQDDGHGHGGHNDAPPSSGGGFFVTLWKTIGTLILVGFLALLCLGIKGCYQWINSPPKQQTIHQQETVNSCKTPCEMYVDWDQHIKSDGRPILVKFYGKKNWIPLSGREDEHFTLEQFSVGVAQFASPPEDKTPVRVQISNR